MATDPQHRGTGAGSALLDEARRIAVADGAWLLWCLARERAVGFYLRHGWTPFADLFDTDLGPHQRMQLRLREPDPAP